MLPDKIFKTALLLSIAGHSLFFYGWPGFLRVSPNGKVNGLPKISYYKSKQVVLPKPLIKEKAAATIKDFTAKKEDFSKKKISVAKSAATGKKTIAATSGEMFKSSKEKSLYLDYYQGIREKIRSVVKYNYSNLSQVGKIYLSFVLDNSGNLKNIDFFDNNNLSATRALKTIVYNSVKKASPFLPFPKGLSQKQLSFSIIISFEKED